MKLWCRERERRERERRERGEREREREREREERERERGEREGGGGAQEGSNLRRHSVTEIQDGNIVVVRSLVQTQIVLQRVFQLKDRQTHTRTRTRTRTRTHTHTHTHTHIFVDSSQISVGSSGQNYVVYVRKIKTFSVAINIIINGSRIKRYQGYNAFNLKTENIAFSVTMLFVHQLFHK